MFQLLTDPEIGIGVLAWYDNANGEIGDVCNGQFGTYTGCDGQTYSIQLEWSNAQNKCVSFGTPICNTVF